MIPDPPWIPPHMNCVVSFEYLITIIVLLIPVVEIGFSRPNLWPRVPVRFKMINEVAKMVKNPKKIGVFEAPERLVSCDPEYAPDILPYSIARFAWKDFELRTILNNGWVGNERNRKDRIW